MDQQKIQDKHPKKHQLQKTRNGILIHSRIQNGRKCWWCDKSGPKGRWTTSHCTGEHKSNFSFDKKSKKKSPKLHRQVSVGEGLAPQCSLWSANAKPPPHCPRNHLRQRLHQLCKRLGRTFHNVNSWFDNCQRHFNQPRRDNALNELTAELPDNKTASHVVTRLRTQKQIQLEQSWTHHGTGLELAWGDHGSRRKQNHHMLSTSFLQPLATGTPS